MTTVKPNFFMAQLQLPVSERNWSSSIDYALNCCSHVHSISIAIAWSY